MPQQNIFYLSIWAWLFKITLAHENVPIILCCNQTFISQASLLYWFEFCWHSNSEKFFFLNAVSGVFWSGWTAHFLSHYEKSKLSWPLWFYSIWFYRKCILMTSLFFSLHAEMLLHHQSLDYLKLHLHPPSHDSSTAQCQSEGFRTYTLQIHTINWWNTTCRFILSCTTCWLPVNPLTGGSQMTLVHCAV